MATLHLLGTGAAFSDARRTTTMLAFQAPGSVVAVDCGGDLVQRLLAAGMDIDDLRALIVTHEHADHAGGFPLFMERIWLGGRRRPVDVHGIAPALGQARRCWEAFETGGWKDVPEIRWHEVAVAEGAPVLEDADWRITAAPGIHGVPVIGLRVEHVPTGGGVAYSCDTEPSDTITRLSRGADILVHEASGAFKGHTSNEDAARVAVRAGAGRLVLVHLPPDVADGDLAEARGIFPNVEFGEDGGRYEF
ncbi:MAG TPA: MBL fold metallo-hydrolase [Longimicrobiaceae bacterium]|nr:MBL fold metallo-hydrolase [Longimicrobiaceae bacterium]